MFLQSGIWHQPFIHLNAGDAVKVALWFNGQMCSYGLNRPCASAVVKARITMLLLPSFLTLVVQKQVIDGLDVKNRSER
jgi:hypothetical protein